MERELPSFSVTQRTASNAAVPLDRVNPTSVIGLRLNKLSVELKEVQFELQVTKEEVELFV